MEIRPFSLSAEFMGLTARRGLVLAKEVATAPEDFNSPLMYSEAKFEAFLVATTRFQAPVIEVPDASPGLVVPLYVPNQYPLLLLPIPQNPELFEPCDANSIPTVG
jgi:hypothetical protein